MRNPFAVNLFLKLNLMVFRFNRNVQQLCFEDIMKYFMFIENNTCWKFYRIIYLGDYKEES